MCALGGRQEDRASREEARGFSAYGAAGVSPGAPCPRKEGVSRLVVKAGRVTTGAWELEGRGGKGEQRVNGSSLGGEKDNLLDANEDIISGTLSAH